MTTIIERDVSDVSGASSILTAVVAIVAILFVVGIAMYLLHIYPFNALSATTPSAVNVNVSGIVPSSNASGQ